MNLGENNNFFRESFRGFNKDDVAEYIAKLSKDYTVNEDKYKDHIAKLSAELKAKTDELENLSLETVKQQQTESLDEIEQKYKDEIIRLTDELNKKDADLSKKDAELNKKDVELNQKDIKLNAMQIQIDLGSIEAEEFTEQRELIDSMTQEMEELREKYEALESEAVALRSNAAEEPKIDYAAVNEVTYKLAESESERLFLFDLLKKTIPVLDIESLRGRDITNASAVSDIAPKSELAGEIEKKLMMLNGFKYRTEQLEIENAAIKEELNKNIVARSDEQKMYETVTADLGSIIYSAKKSAEEILAKARTEADNMVGEAKIEAGYIIDDANVRKEAISEENKKNIADLRAKYETVKKEHENMIRKFEEISESYSNSLYEIGDTINNVYDTVNSDI